MPPLLLKNAAALLTMDPRQPLIEAGGLLVLDNVIELAGPSADLPQQADSVLDAAGMVVLPGLINTHHHLYQTLTRALPGAQDAELFDWLTRLYPVWGEMDDEAVYHSALVGTAGRGGRRHPGRLPTGHPALSRSRALFHAAGRSGPVLALLGHRRSHAPDRRAGTLL